MPYNSGTGAYERRATTVIDATPDGDTVAVAIDVKLDAGIDDYVTDLNHHKTNGNHYPATSTHTDSRFLDQSPAGVVSWKDGVPAPDAALKDFSNVADGAVPVAKLASGILPAQVAGTAYVKTNILGTVDQSSGVPTGAIIERGSNANGEYVRFADGTQICTGIGVLHATTWAFPAGFASVPNVTQTVTASAANPRITTHGSPTNTSVTLYIFELSGIAGSGTVFPIAIGRWF